MRSGRYNMKADLVHVEGDTPPNEIETGHWEEQQDDITGEIIRVWVVDDTSPDPGTQPNVVYNTSIPCLARGYVGTGLQAGSVGESFGELYEATDTIRIWFPANVRLTRKDQITNVRGANGEIIWREEELNEESPKPTIFSVMGVVPLIGPFGVHEENYAICERAEIQE